MTKHLKRSAPALTVIIRAVSTGLALAADVGKAVAAAESRKRAAENGARTIRAKSPQAAEQVRTIYEEAAQRHNAWLEAVTASPGQGEGAPADAAAASAASSLIAWVAARNQALGEPVIAGATAVSSETLARQNLIDIAAEASRRTRGANDKKRNETLTPLNRLRWKSWDEL